jgi:hypothetical protein
MRLTALSCCLLLLAGSVHADDPPRDDRPGIVRCANLIYARNKTSVCFADHFLADVQKQTNIWTDRKFTSVHVDSKELYQYPFAIMTGEGAFTLTDPQRTALRDYLTGGGFVVASAGCSSKAWKDSFAREIAAVFPDTPLAPIGFEHPIFHTVYDIKALETKSRTVRAQLEGLTINDRVVLVYSPEGLNDTGNVGGNCCCCGGNEVKNARQVNANLLTYAVTH